MRDITEKIVFSERCETIRQGVKSRSTLENIRIGKFTKPDDDGLTPFEDVHMVKGGKLWLL